MSEPWLKTFMVTNARGEEVPVVGTDVDGFLAAYAADDNVFWQADIGHLQNVMDELLARLSLAEHLNEVRLEMIKQLADQIASSSRA